METGINAEFIAKWHPKYNEIENDEDEYRRLIKLISEETRRTGSFSQNTFEELLNWKAARVKGKIKWINYDIYKLVFKESFKSPNTTNIEKLTELYGIGYPVASTIMHFVFPDQIPIIDIRTESALKYFNLLDRNRKYYTKSLKCYNIFIEKIMRIKYLCKTFSLREIDRALFAFHKLVLDTKSKENQCKCKKHLQSKTREQ